MNYTDLKAEISERSISQLPGLLQHVVRLCAIRPVFKDKVAMLRFIDKCWDAAWVADQLPPKEDERRRTVFEPRGTKFYSYSHNTEMILVSEDAGAWAGWLCYRHPDGQWVSLRKATKEDRAELDNAIIKAHHHP